MSYSYNLEDLEQEVHEALLANAVLIFWNHQVQSFRHFLIEDNDEYHVELRNLRRQVRSGVITTVKAGLDLSVGGTNQHVMEVTYAGVQCGPNMLLRKEGKVEDADVTPYLFKSENSRNMAVRYIVRG